jgi:STE24 endopeptidase
LAPVLFAAASAEAAVRALVPREAVLAPVAVDLRQHFSAHEIARGRRYARPQMAIGLTRATVDAIALAAIVRRSPRKGAPAITGAALSVGLSLPGLPLAALARHRALKVGLATQTWRDWSIDLLKSSAIQSVMAGAGAAGVTVVTRRWPRDWWLPAAGGSVIFGGALAALAPVVLDPIFNDFTPLADGQTRSDVLELAARAEVKVGQVYSIDASRRTTAANAYVTGLGPTKRVVLFDTLLDRYSRDEIKVVVAHELAHVRHRDVARSIAFAALTAPAGALAVQRLSWALSTERGTTGALPALAMAAGAVSIPVGVIANRLSRAVERRADAFSLRLSDAPEAFVSFERAIALQNIADLEPPKALTALLSTHPPTDERIGAALAYQKKRAEPAL